MQLVDLKYTISSHKKSYEKTFEPLCRSLIESGIDPNDIYFFIGGYSEYKKIENDLNVNLYQTDHNSIDVTGLISIIDIEAKADYWFLLHDTMIAGPNFAKVVESFKYEDCTVTMTSDGFSMCVGVYPERVLIENRDKLMSMKNRDYSDTGLQNAKKLAIDTEDYFLNPKRAFFNRSHRLTKGPVDYYGNGTLRIIEYFPDIDLYKIKANWHPKPNYELNL